MNGFVGTANRFFARAQFNARRRGRLYREFASLQRSGMHRGEALDLMWQVASHDGGRPSEPVAIILADARNGIRNGLSLAQSFKFWIPKDDFMLIGAIEDHDAFADYLEAWCDLISERQGVRGDAVAALAYPVMLLALAYGLLVYLDLKIVPALSDLLPRQQWSGYAAWLDWACAFASGNAVAVAAFSACLPPLTAFLLPRWSRSGRAAADRLPVFSLYRAYSGIAFLQCMGALMSGGFPAAEAIARIRGSASPYVGHRLDLIRANLLNGCNLGEAMQLTGTGWPDPELALSLRILSQSPEFPTHLQRTTKDWRRLIGERTGRVFGTLRTLAFLAVFGVISGVILAMYEIQGQIASGLH
ncbi:MAG: type II secretion system F family protein [Rhodobacteraceae bacterium]|nr:type II secretion system F family protein [Paracoccaceae bacterium]